MAKKTQYFDPRGFVQKVMQDSKFGEMSDTTRRALEEGIHRRLGERIMATIIDQFSEREFTIMEKMMEDHPEIDNLDAIILVAGEIPHLQALLEKAVMDLYEEMTYDANRLQKALESAKSMGNSGG